MAGFPSIGKKILDLKEWANGEREYIPGDFVWTQAVQSDYDYYQKARDDINNFLSLEGIDEIKMLEIIGKWTQTPMDRSKFIKNEITGGFHGHYFYKMAQEEIGEILI